MDVLEVFVAMVVMIVSVFLVVFHFKTKREYESIHTSADEGASEPEGQNNKLEVAIPFGTIPPGEEAVILYEPREKSTHKVEVVEVRLEKHPDADNLSIVNVFDGYTVIVRTGDWKDGDLGAYIPPDSIVDTTRPEFAFLGKHNRIKAKKLRGVYSMGLLVPAPEGSQLGENVAELLGVTRYEPEVRRTYRGKSIKLDGDFEAGPNRFVPGYDVDSLRRYGRVFEEGETVLVTEKIHGCNSRFVFSSEEQRMFCGSRRQWKKQGEASPWWRILEVHPEIEEFCRANPNVVVYGEIYGWVQDLRYGHGPGEISFAAFDLFRNGRWVDFWEARSLGIILPWVPIVSIEPYNLQRMLELAEGESLIPRAAGQIREGIVIKPPKERQDWRVGRVQLKVVANSYLERAADKEYESVLDGGL